MRIEAVLSADISFATGSIRAKTGRPSSSDVNLVLINLKNELFTLKIFENLLFGRS